MIFKFDLVLRKLAPFGSSLLQKKSASRKAAKTYFGSVGFGALAVAINSNLLIPASLIAILGFKLAKEDRAGESDPIA